MCSVFSAVVFRIWIQSYPYFFGLQIRIRIVRTGCIRYMYISVTNRVLICYFKSNSAGLKTLIFCCTKKNSRQRNVGYVRFLQNINDVTAVKPFISRVGLNKTTFLHWKYHNNLYYLSYIYMLYFSGSVTEVDSTLIDM